MSDPYQVLGVGPESDDETIRRRYLELVRKYPPEQYPKEFAAVRSAYEAVRSLEARVKKRLLETHGTDSIESIIEELACRSSRPKITVRMLLNALAKHP